MPNELLPNVAYGENIEWMLRNIFLEVYKQSDRTHDKTDCAVMPEKNLRTLATESIDAARLIALRDMPELKGIDVRQLSPPVFQMVLRKTHEVFNKHGIAIIAEVADIMLADLVDKTEDELKAAGWETDPVKCGVYLAFCEGQTNDQQHKWENGEKLTVALSKFIKETGEQPQAESSSPTIPETPDVSKDIVKTALYHLGKMKFAATNNVLTLDEIRILSAKTMDSEDDKRIYQSIFNHVTAGFYLLAADGYTFYPVESIQQEYGRTIQENYPNRSRRFWNFSTSYWTLKTLAEKVGSSKRAHALAGILSKIEIDIAYLFFPTPGIVAPLFLRKIGMKSRLRSYWNDAYIKEFFQ